MKLRFLFSCALAILGISSADARVRGAPSIISNNPALSGLVIGDGVSPFVNFIKMGVSGSPPQTGITDIYPNFLNAGTNLPNGVRTVRLGYSVGLPPTYFGKYVLVVNGTVSGANGITLGFSTNSLGTVYSTTGSPTLASCTNGNVPPCSWGASSLIKTTGSNYTMTFDLSALITGAVNNGSGLVRITIPTTNSITNGKAITVSGVIGSNGAGCGANGTFTAANVTATTVDLTGSTFPGGCTYTSGGQLFPYTGAASLSLPFNFDTGTYSSFTGFLLCKEADYLADNTCSTTGGKSAWAGGFNDDFVASLATLRPAHIRFLDVNKTTNESIPGTYASWPTSSAFSYNLQHDWWDIPNWFGSNSGTNSYSISCASGTACTYLLTGGAPKNGDYVQFLNVNASTSTNPTIQITDANAVTSAAIPIFNLTAPQLIVNISGTAGAGGTLALKFDTTPLGAYTCLSGGTRTTSNVTINNGDSSSTIKANLQTLIQADTVLQAQPTAVASRNAGGQFSLYFASRACATTVTPILTGAAGVTVDIGTATVGQLAANTLYSMTYSSIMGGFIQGYVGGMPSSWPWLTQIQLANAVSIKSGVKVACWLQPTMLWSDASVTSLINLLAANLCIGGVKVELGNEIWNTGTFLVAAQALGLSSALGLNGYDGVSPGAQGNSQAYEMLRTRQIAGLFGGAAQMVAAWQEPGPSVTQLNGTVLCGTTCSNQAYQNAIGVDYTTAPNRPRDYIPIVSAAPYYHGGIVSGDYNSSGSYGTWSATTSSVASNVLTVGGSVTGPIWWNQGITSCNGTYIKPTNLNDPTSAQLSGKVTTTLNGAVTDNAHTWTLTSNAGLSPGMWIYNATTGSINATVVAVLGGNQITAGAAGTGKTYRSAGANDTIIFGGGPGTYNLNSTSCAIGSSTITGGDVLGLQYAADNYCTASGVCSTGNAGIGSLQDSYDWFYADLLYGSKKNQADQGTSLAGKVWGYQSLGSLATTLGATAQSYEGGYDGFPPTTASATSMGLPSSSYGMTGNSSDPIWDGYLGLAMLAWKNTASFKAGVTYQHNQELSFEPAGSMTQWYVFSVKSRWTLFNPPSSLYSTPYQSYSAICAYNGNPC